MKIQLGLGDPNRVTFSIKPMVVIAVGDGNYSYSNYAAYAIAIRGYNGATTTATRGYYVCISSSTTYGNLDFSSNSVDGIPTFAVVGGTQPNITWNFRSYVVFGY